MQPAVVSRLDFSNLYAQKLIYFLEVQVFKTEFFVLEGKKRKALQEKVRKMALQIFEEMSLKTPIFFEFDSSKTKISTHIFPARGWLMCSKTGCIKRLGPDVCYMFVILKQGLVIENKTSYIPIQFELNRMGELRLL